MTTAKRKVPWSNVPKHEQDKYIKRAAYLVKKGL